MTGCKSVKIRIVLSLILAPILFFSLGGIGVKRSPSPSPTHAFHDLDSDGLVDCIDADGDQKCETSGMWDADGDGSTYSTCTGDGTPFPECLYSGDVIYPDFMDDVNCMIPAQDGSAKCSNTYTMEWDGVIQLRGGVRYIAFPCWDIASWLADANTPGALPSDTDLNDPRDELATDTEGSTRHNSSVDDGSMDDCPVDENGFPLASITTHFWQGKVRGRGRPTTRLNELSASNPLRGTMIVDDRGQWDASWYGGTSHRTFQSGSILVAASGCDYPSSGCGSSVYGAYLNASQRGGKGWGQLTEAIDWQDQDPTLCVCNSKNDGDAHDCENIAGGSSEALASEDGWISDLEDGDVLILDYDAAPETDTRNVVVAVRIDGDGDTFVQGSCSDDESLEVKIGWASLAKTSANMDQGVGWQRDTDCSYGNSQCGIFHIPSEAFSSGFKLENLTWTPQDTPNRSGNDCSDSSIPYSPNGVDPTTDEDCDEKGGIAIRTGGDSEVNRVTVLDWGGFWLDGNAMLAKVSLLESRFSHGWGTAIMDPGSYAQIRNSVITNSVLASGLISSYGMPLDIEGLIIENVATISKLFSFDYMRGLRMSNIRFVNVSSERSVFQISCGIENAVIQDIFVTGRVGRGDLNAVDMIEINANACPASSPVRGNIFWNFAEDAPGVISHMVRINASEADDVYGNIFGAMRSFREYTGSSKEGCLVSFDNSPYYAAESNFFLGGMTLDATGDAPFCIRNSVYADPLPAGLKPNAIGFMRTQILDHSPPSVGSATTNGLQAWADPDTSCDTACADLGAQMQCQTVVAGGSSKVIPFCGNGGNAADRYIGPVAAPGDDITPGGATCDGMDEAAVGDADEVPWGDATSYYRVESMSCQLDGGVDDTVDMTLYDDTAPVGAITCTITADGGVTTCSVVASATIAANSALAILADPDDDDLSGADLSCALMVSTTDPGLEDYVQGCCSCTGIQRQCGCNRVP